MKISVVIPAYNEERMIGQVIEEVKSKGYGVIVVDDGSADKTAELAGDAGVEVIRHGINRGQGAALQTGILAALRQGSEVIVTFDADGQFIAGEISEITAPIRQGTADVVLGTRFSGKPSETPPGKKLVLKLATWVTRLYTGLKITDTHNGFRAFSRVAAEKIRIRQDGMAHASEILEQIKAHNLRYVEVPVTLKYTEYSKNKGQKISNSLKIFYDLLIGRISK